MIRTQYQQKIMLEVYPQVAIEAIHRGFKGSWERLIAKKLEEDANKDISEAVVLLESTNNNSLEAAFLITSAEAINLT